MQWDSGSTNSYRMGKEGKYDLQLAHVPGSPGDASAPDDGADASPDDNSNSGGWGGGIRSCKGVFTTRSGPTRTAKSHCGSE